MRRTLCRLAGAWPVVLLAATVPACTGDAYPPPPATRTETVADTLHGVVIEDDYRWLEDQDAEETRAWIDAQNAYAEQIIGESPLRDAFRQLLRAFMDVPDVGTPRRTGDFEYFTMRRANEDRERLYRRPSPAEGDTMEPSLDGEYEVVLDPAEFDPALRTSLSLIDVSADGRRMAYSVRRGGADEVEVRIRDLTTGEDLPDVLPAALYGGIEFDADGQSVTYVHRSRVDGPRLKRHVLGTDIATDSILFGDGIAPTAFLSAGLVDDGRWRILSVQRGWAGHDVYVQDARTGALRTVVTDSAAHLSTRWHDGRLWIVTDLGAPRYRLVTADPANPGPENWTVVLPEDDDVLQSHAIIGGRIHATYLHDVSDRIRVFAMDGTPAGEIDVPDHMTASIRPSASAETSSTA